MARHFLTALLLLFFLLPPMPAVADDARAMQLINSQGCKGCHRLNGEGGTVGPDLTGVGKRLTPQQLRQVLLDPQSRKSDAIMPSFAHLSADAIDRLVDFLSRQR